MSTLEEQIEIGAPAEVAWDQLHRIADYPRFVEGVLHASARGSHRARLDVAVDGGHREFDAFFTDRGHNRVMTWETVDEPHLRGTFALHPLDEHRTQVQVRIEYEPAAVEELFGGAPHGFALANAIERTVRTDLEQLRDLVEHRTG
ncbi:SRPBCC family protein [Streptomyces sp. NRRL B-24484]|uniref:SRPBCC family protein n=1 Tax=Streptomyces sp. NRRL B-24484 TaxID=1463833 RepID=UPI0004C0B15E|nr:SRPBCC family protein [Streptomyces sp. NRRL B-24484]